jgi:tetratricopeptide (TPR) repeat protein
VNFSKKYFYPLLAFLLVLAIFLWMPTKHQKGESEEAKTANVYTLESYKSDFFQKQSDSIQKTLSTLESDIQKAPDSLSKVKAFSALIAYYNQLESPENSALIVYQKAKLINNTNSWNISGDNFIQCLMDVKVDSALLPALSQYAIKCYENSLLLDSTHMDSKLKLAQCYMELGGPPMKGVQILLSLAKEDSTNIRAQFLLAKFGLVSGQFDKVLTRTNIILSLQPENVEARLMRVDALAQLNQKKEAIEDLQIIKGTKGIPGEMKNQIEIAIKEIEAK